MAGVADGVETDAGLRGVVWCVVLGIAEELATCVAAAGGVVMASVAALGVSSLMPNASLNVLQLSFPNAECLMKIHFLPVT